MHKLLFILLLSLPALTVWVPAPTAQAWQSSQAGIVVLTNRQTIQGIVEQQQEKVSVRLPSGSLIVLPKPRVLFVCQTLGEAYWELAARTRSTDAQGQIDVYRWCVRNHLFDEAANHLLMLQEMDIPAKTLMQLDVSLQITQKQHTESEQAMIAAHATPAPTPQPHQEEPTAGWQGDQTIEIPNLHDTAQSGPNSERLPAIDEFGNEVDSRIDGKVQQVSWEQPISGSAQQVNPLIMGEKLRQRLSASESLPYSDLDRLARSMPKGSVGSFRKQVEPLLQQSCSQCHRSGATENAFKIFQERHGAIDRRMSQKNLFQVLNLADSGQPQDSLLIQYATLAHGNQTDASFQWQDEQLKALKQWLILVSDNPLLPLEEFSPDRDEQQPTRFATPKVADPDAAEFTQRLPTVSRAPKSEPVKPADFSSGSVDPFDADTFNRKFRVR